MVNLDINVILGLIFVWIAKMIVSDVIEVIMNNRALQTKLDAKVLMPIETFESSLKNITQSVVTIILSKIQGDRKVEPTDYAATVPQTVEVASANEVEEHLNDAVSQIMDKLDEQNGAIAALQVDFTNVLSVKNLQKVLEDPKHIPAEINNVLDGGTDSVENEEEEEEDADEYDNSE